MSPRWNRTPQQRLQLLREARRASLAACRGAWWWPCVTPCLNKATQTVYLRCEICGDGLSLLGANKHSETARGHLRSVHKILLLSRPSKAKLEELRAQYLEEHGKKSPSESDEPPAAEGSRKKSRRGIGQSSANPIGAVIEEQPSLRILEGPERRGFNAVGIPAQCRRECYTEAFMVSAFQQQCSAMVDSFSNYVMGIPDIASIDDSMNIDVSDLAFVDQFENCSADVDVASVDLNTTFLMRKTGFNYNYVEKRLREVERAKEGFDTDGNDGRRENEDSDEEKESGETKKDESKKRKKSDEDDEGCDDGEMEDEPWMETLKKVHGCMEKMAKKLFSVHHMLASNNVRTGGMYRTGVMKICHKIAEHLEEHDGRVFRSYFQRDRTFANNKNIPSEKLTPEEEQGIDSMIGRLEEHLERQCELIGSGKEILREEILSWRNYQERVSAGKKREELEESKSLGVVDEVGSETRSVELSEDEGDGGGEKLASDGEEGEEEEVLWRARGLEVNKDVVALVKICHPTLHIAKEAHILAAGHHTLEEIFSLLKCQLQRNMERIGQRILSSYFFMEGTFYNNVPSPESEDYSKNIREFCEKNDCCFPLDPGKIPPVRFKDSDMACTVDQLLLRVSNQPLYIFCHHGSCEHLVQIVDVRLAHKSDPPELKRNPIMANKPHLRRRKCALCQKAQATVVAYGDGLGVSDPGFFCVDCFECLHYDEWGNLKVKPFITVPYWQE